MHGRSAPSRPVVAPRYTSPMPPRAASLSKSRRPSVRGSASVSPVSAEEKPSVTSPISTPRYGRGRLRPSLLAIRGPHVRVLAGGGPNQEAPQAHAPLPHPPRRDRLEQCGPLAGTHGRPAQRARLLTGSRDRRGPQRSATLRRRVERPGARAGDRARGGGGVGRAPCV